jgi:alkylhydroperoxidase/carboxymuconolactone decarboxylase family protein YurZ
MTAETDAGAIRQARLDVARGSMRRLFDVEWITKPRPGEPESAQDLEEVLLTQAFSETWARSGLDDRTKCLMSLAIDVAQGTTKELGLHVGGALVVGVTPEEIVEALIHTAAYCGASKTAGAWSVARKVIAAHAERGAQGL